MSLVFMTEIVPQQPIAALFKLDRREIVAAFVPRSRSRKANGKGGVAAELIDFKRGAIHAGPASRGSFCYSFSQRRGSTSIDETSPLFTDAVMRPET